MLEISNGGSYSELLRYGVIVVDGEGNEYSNFIQPLQDAPETTGKQVISDGKISKGEQITIKIFVWADQDEIESRDAIISSENGIYLDAWFYAEPATE